MNFGRKSLKPQSDESGAPVVPTIEKREPKQASQRIRYHPHTPLYLGACFSSEDLMTLRPGILTFETESIDSQLGAPSTSFSMKIARTVSELRSHLNIDTQAEADFIFGSGEMSSNLDLTLNLDNEEIAIVISARSEYSRQSVKSPVLQANIPPGLDQDKFEARYGDSYVALVRREIVVNAIIYMSKSALAAGLKYSASAAGEAGIGPISGSASLTVTASLTYAKKDESLKFAFSAIGGPGLSALKAALANISAAATFDTSTMLGSIEKALSDYMTLCTPEHSVPLEYFTASLSGLYTVAGDYVAPEPPDFPDLESRTIDSALWRAKRLKRAKHTLQLLHNRGLSATDDYTKLKEHVDLLEKGLNDLRKSYLNMRRRCMSRKAVHDELAELIPNADGSKLQNVTQPLSIIRGQAVAYDTIPGQEYSPKYDFLIQVSGYCLDNIQVWISPLRVTEDKAKPSPHAGRATIPPRIEEPTSEEDWVSPTEEMTQAIMNLVDFQRAGCIVYQADAQSVCRVTHESTSQYIRNRLDFYTGRSLVFEFGDDSNNAVTQAFYKDATRATLVGMQRSLVDLDVELSGSRTIRVNWIDYVSWFFREMHASGHLYHFSPFELSACWFEKKGMTRDFAVYVRVTDDFGASASACVGYCGVGYNNFAPWIDIAHFRLNTGLYPPSP